MANTHSDVQGQAPEPVIRVQMLGGFQVTVHGRPLADAAWPSHIGSQGLKLLLSRPGRALTSDVLAEWSGSQPGSDMPIPTLQLLASVLRQTLGVAGLPQQADPIVSDGESVRLDGAVNIWVDADEFELLLAAAQTADDPLPLLEQADSLFCGDYLPDDRNDAWTQNRRLALRRAWIELQQQLAHHREQHGDLGGAAAAVQRLLDFDPANVLAGQELMRLLLRQRELAATRRHHNPSTHAPGSTMTKPGTAPAETVHDQSVVHLNEGQPADESPANEQAAVSDTSDAHHITAQPADAPTPDAHAPHPYEPGGHMLLTFLLTDIEGSVPHWERNGESMQQAMVRHDALIDACVTEHGGSVVQQQGEGDSRFAVFTRPADALTVAFILQQQFQDESWPTSSPLRIRVALHTGEAIYRAGHYYGSTVNRCARLRDLAHGGQILLSEATAGLVRESLPLGASLLDLGEHHLIGFSRAERVLQLIHLILPSEFPPLRGTRRPLSNIPSPATLLVGREREVEAACDMVLNEGVRLLTLTGPGGVGKTRLGVDIAAKLAEYFPHGVCFVGLAQVVEADRVAPTVAQALGVHDAGGWPLVDSVKAFLRGRQLLLLLDTFEHVLAAAPMIAELLAACPDLRVLATSREVLHLSGEHALVIAPLSLPPQSSSTPEELLKSEAVTLFVQRVRATSGGFTLTEEIAPIIAEICRRLDGLPLAIELAAARARLLPPVQLRQRLEHRLPLLTGGARDLPAHQQAMRATIAWSYDLLTPREQRLFRRLSMFVGGCSLEAIEFISAADGESGAIMLDGLASLIDKSLIRQRDHAGEMRIVMLDTIREFGIEQVEQRGEAIDIRRQHAEFYAALAETAEHELTGPGQAVWLDRIEIEQDNLRMAMRSSLESGSPETGLRVAAALWRFWQIRGYLREGHEWLTNLLNLPSYRMASPVRAKALNASGFLAFMLGNYAEAGRMHEEALGIRRHIGEQLGIAESLHNLGLVVRCLADFEEARPLFEEALTMSRSIGNPFWQARTLNGLARVVAYQGQADAARALLDESLAMSTTAGDTWGRAIALGYLAEVVWSDGNRASARALVEESLGLWLLLRDERGIAQCLESAVLFSTSVTSIETEVRLLAAASSRRTAVGEPPSPTRAAALRTILDNARQALGTEAYAGAWAEGWTMSLDEATAQALTILRSLDQSVQSAIESAPAPI